MPGLNQFDPGGDPFAPLSAGAGTGGTALTLALDITAGPPLTNIAAQSSLLVGGSVQWVFVLITPEDASDAFDLDITQYAGRMAIAQAEPLGSDWVAAVWLNRTRDPFTGYYLMITVGPGQTLDPGTGRWQVTTEVDAGGEVIRTTCPGALIVE